MLQSGRAASGAAASTSYGAPRPSVLAPSLLRKSTALGMPGLRPALRTGVPVPTRQPLRQPEPSDRETVILSSSSGNAEEDDEMKKSWKSGRNEGEMTWPWKLMAAILYILPWVDVTEKSVYFTERFPAFIWVEFFTEPIEHWYNIHEFAPLLIFFALYLGIVRNKKISHVARYHIMMGVMLDIVAMILIVTEENLPTGVLWTPWSDLFYACTFWFIFLLIVYCMFFCFLGWYCEIPLISEGVYMQIEQAESMGQ